MLNTNLAWVLLGLSYVGSHLGTRLKSEAYLESQGYSGYKLCKHNKTNLNDGISLCFALTHVPKLWCG